jgi:hypothetical protein
MQNLSKDQTWEVELHPPVKTTVKWMMMSKKTIRLNKRRRERRMSLKLNAKF